VLVRGDQFAVVRARTSYDEMLAREPLAPWLSRGASSIPATLSPP